jgi:hypothetical protein
LGVASASIKEQALAYYNSKVIDKQITMTPPESVPKMAEIEDPHYAVCHEPTDKFGFTHNFCNGTYEDYNTNITYTFVKDDASGSFKGIYYEFGWGKVKDSNDIKWEWSYDNEISEEDGPYSFVDHWENNVGYEGDYQKTYDVVTETTFTVTEWSRKDGESQKVILEETPTQVYSYAEVHNANQTWHTQSWTNSTATDQYWEYFEGHPTGGVWEID